MNERLLSLGENYSDINHNLGINDHNFDDISHDMSLNTTSEPNIEELKSWKLWTNEWQEVNELNSTAIEVNNNCKTIKTEVIDLKEDSSREEIITKRVNELKSNDKTVNNSIKVSLFTSNRNNITNCEEFNTNSNDYELTETSTQIITKENISNETQNNRHQNISLNKSDMNSFDCNPVDTHYEHILWGLH